MCPTIPRALLITDAAINIAPGLAEKRDICQNAIDLAHIIGIAEPKVAILSAVETVSDRLPSTVDAAALSKMAERGQITGALVDGPLAFDNAVSMEAAAIKAIRSPVAGQADILVVPDLESGNMLAKQLTFLTMRTGQGSWWRPDTDRADQPRRSGAHPPGVRGAGLVVGRRKAPDQMTPDAVLTLNCGSSSIKFAVFERGGGRLLRGRIENLGSEPHFQAWNADGALVAEKKCKAGTHESFFRHILSLADDNLDAAAGGRGAQGRAWR
jgi:Phosphotransacetylase